MRLPAHSSWGAAIIATMQWHPQLGIWFSPKEVETFYVHVIGVDVDQSDVRRLIHEELIVAKKARNGRDWMIPVESMFAAYKVLVRENERDAHPLRCIPATAAGICPEGRVIRSSDTPKC